MTDRGYDPTVEPPRDRRAIAALDHAIETLDRFRQHAHRTLATYRTWTEKGYATDTMPDPVSGSAPGSKPPPGHNEKNRAHLAYEQIHDDITAIERAADGLEAKASIAIDPPTADLGLPGCTSCARIPSHDHDACRAKSRHLGVSTDHNDVGCPEDGTAGSWYQKVLVKDRGLCRWCYDFERQWDVWPAEEIVEARRDGRKITTKMIRDAMPDVA